MKDILINMEPKHDYLICIDSDGCVFDNMELKHKECFCPATVNVWELQGVSRFARESAEFVNLYSKTRGYNRFPAIIRTLELTYARKEVKERGYKMPDLTPLKAWIKDTPVLSATALQEYYESHDVKPVLEQAARWSREVDENIARIVRNVPPFPHVAETLKKLTKFADIVIVSATPHEAIVREWTEHDLIQYVNVVAGQELGTKKECIYVAVTGHYDLSKVLMVGDAPGDHSAAKDNNVAFYPIIPGRETESWKQLNNEVAERFSKGEYIGQYMNEFLDKFYSVLLDSPKWE